MPEKHQAQTVVQKLDVKDQRLLLALFEDGRATTTQLGRDAGMSQELATYRIARLRERGILKGVVPVLNYAVLGYTTYRLQLRLSPITPERRQAFIDDMRGLPQLNWLVQLSGSWDLVLLFTMRSPQEFTDTYNEILERHGAIIDEKLFTIVTEITHLPPTYLLKHERAGLVTRQEQGTFQLEENQRKVLEKLFEDGRKPLLEIAREIGVSVTTVKYHLDALRRSKVIVGFKPVINLFALGFEHFKVTLELMNPAEKKRLKSILLHHDNVVYITESLGRYDLEFEAEFDTVEALLRMIEELKSQVHIKAAEIIFANKEIVLNRLPRDSDPARGPPSRRDSPDGQESAPRRRRP